MKYAPALLLMSALCAFPGQAKAEGERVVYVVAVGNNLPPPDHQELSRLRYADDDAVRFFELFGPKLTHRTLLASVDGDTQRRHAASAELAVAPTYATLKSTFERYRLEMQRDRARGRVPVVFFTFSGHGASDEQGEPTLTLMDVPLTRARLYDDLLPLLSDGEVHLIVDACRAAGVIGVRGAFDVELEGETEKLAESERSGWIESRSLARFPNVGALVASAADQESHEWSRIESGVFTHEVLSALRGAADANGDLKVAYSEVQAFVASANRDISDPKARPAVLTHLPKNGRDTVLLALEDLTDARLLYGDAGVLGHFHIELENGERLLDANIAPGFRTALAVPQQQGFFVRDEQREAEVTKSSRHLTLAALDFHRSEVSTRGSVEHSLRDTLWKTAYGPVYYRGFVDSAGMPGVTFGGPAPIRQDATTSSSRQSTKRKVAIAAASMGAASLLAFGTSLWLTLGAKHDFDNTDREKRAHQLRDRYSRRLTATLLTGGLSAVAAGTTFLLWPHLTLSETGPVEARLEVTCRF